MCAASRKCCIFYKKLQILLTLMQICEFKVLSGCFGFVDGTNPSLLRVLEHLVVFDL